MPFSRISKKALLIAAGLVVFIVAGTGVLITSDCEICEAANQILLQGTVAQNCGLDAQNQPAAASLDLTTSGSRRILVARVEQWCNKKSGYTLSIASTNCSSGTGLGAKLVDTGTSGEQLTYNVDFDNPAASPAPGSTDVSGLLNGACPSPAVGRTVSNEKVKPNQFTDIFVNVTGNPDLAAGTYEDRLTFTMAVTP